MEWIGVANNDGIVIHVVFVVSPPRLDPETEYLPRHMVPHTSNFNVHCNLPRSPTIPLKKHRHVYIQG